MKKTKIDIQEEEASKVFDLLSCGKGIKEFKSYCKKYGLNPIIAWSNYESYWYKRNIEGAFGI